MHLTEESLYELSCFCFAISRVLSHLCVSFSCVIMSYLDVDHLTVGVHGFYACTVTDFQVCCRAVDKVKGRSFYSVQTPGSY